jgi:glyoxylase-like metal-dependent hydrolase (beta-lactamase superfamily II)
MQYESQIETQRRDNNEKHGQSSGSLRTDDEKRAQEKFDTLRRRSSGSASQPCRRPERSSGLSPEIAAKAPKDAQPFFQSAQAIAAPYIRAGKWHTFSGTETIVDGMQLVPLPGHTPGHTGYEFSSKGHKILFWGDTIHAQRVQLQHPELTVVFDIDPTAAAATRNQLLPKLARENIVIAGPHMLFPGLGRLHKEGSGYSWAPVAFTDQWVDQ